MARPVVQKMGIRPGVRSHLVDVPAAVLPVLETAQLDLDDTLQGLFGYLHLFVLTRAGMDDGFPRLAAHLAPTGMLWVSWPKGRRLGTDLTLPEVIRIGYRHGLVESTSLAVDATWSAIKFTHPKPGKEYRNSYGTLPGQTPAAGEGVSTP